MHTYNAAVVECPWHRRGHADYLQACDAATHAARDFMCYGTVLAHSVACRCELAVAVAFNMSGSGGILSNAIAGKWWTARPIPNNYEILKCVNTFEYIEVFGLLCQKP
eukprot:7774376-Alexandrium_andersonii.AAC.1